MKTYRSVPRGVAAEIVILVVALIGGAGWFGVKEIKTAVKQHAQDQAAQELVKSQAALEAANATARLERERADRALGDAAAARAVERVKQVAAGRMIQRASAAGALAASQLPLSLQRNLLVGEFALIDESAEQLFGRPDDLEIANWRERAQAALQNQIALEKELAEQKTMVTRLNGELSQATNQRIEAEKRAVAANEQARQADGKVTAAIVVEKTAVEKMKEAVDKGDAMGSLLLGLKLLVGVVAGAWVLGLMLKIFSIGVPADGPLAKGLNLAANTAHAFLAPMAVLGETHAKRTTDKLVDSAGNFITDVREKLPPAMQEEVTNMMDVALSPTFQEKICRAHHRIVQKRAVKAC